MIASHYILWNKAANKQKIVTVGFLEEFTSVSHCLSRSECHAVFLSASSTPLHPLQAARTLSLLRKYIISAWKPPVWAANEPKWGWLATEPQTALTGHPGAPTEKRRVKTSLTDRLTPLSAPLKSSFSKIYLTSDVLGFLIRHLYPDISEAHFGHLSQM